MHTFVTYYRYRSPHVFFENYDLKSVVKPVDVDRLEFLLKNAGYNPENMHTLVDGFKFGFDIRYRGNPEVQMRAPNLKFREVGNKVMLWNKVMKEVQAKCYAEPFDSIPYKHFIQSPVGLVPKDGGKDCRLIFHLSYPRNAKTSLNANTPKEFCTVRYPDFHKAVQLCIKVGVGCKLSKSDMESAFRILGVMPNQWQWLIMKVESPYDGKTYFFVDKCLPFRAAISCAIFQSFSDAIAFIVRQKTKHDNVKYLEDFLFVVLLRIICDGQLNTFLDVCCQIRFPVSIEKTFFSTTQITFLSFLIGSVAQLVLIPTDKINKEKLLITQALEKKSKEITIKQCQRICGFLNFLGRSIVPGRVFTRRLYRYTSGSQLKPHYHMCITREIRSDLTMWMEFLNHPSVYAWGFMDFSATLVADEISMFSDVAKSWKLGYGRVCDNSWLYGQWESNFIEKYDPSIAYLKLYTLVATVLAWIHRFKNRRVIMFCDNQSVVEMVNATSTSCKHCMTLIRILVLKCLQENVRVFARYVKSQENMAADYLS